MKLAMWLLGMFDVPLRNDALIGDLAEERAAGRSVVWVWTQTFAAIASTVVRDLRGHWVLALRAIATGWAGILFVGWTGDRFSWPLFPLYVGLPLYLVVAPIALGWIVAQTHRAKRAAMVLAFTASVLIYFPWRCYQCGPVPFDLAFVFPLGVIGILIGGFLPRLKRMIGTHALL